MPNCAGATTPPTIRRAAKSLKLDKLVRLPDRAQPQRCLSGIDTSAVNRRCRPLPISRLRELSATTWALAVEPMHEPVERRRLRKRHDRLEGERISVSVVPIRHAANGMAENLDRRLRHVFIVVRRARFSQILQDPGLLVDISVMLDDGIENKTKPTLAIDVVGAQDGSLQTGRRWPTRQMSMTPARYGR